MSRNMKNANARMFALLVTYSERRDHPIADPSSARWVQSDEIDKDWLKNLRIRRTLGFGRHRYLSWLEHGPENQTYVSLVGFEHDPDHPEMLAIESNSGITVSLISELAIQPNVSAARVRNAVEVGKLGEADYEGHDHNEILSLFPPIKIFKSDAGLDETIIWSVFLRLSVDECRYGSSWIDEELAESLAILADLNVPSLPYAELCRSIFDLDPRSLFMALYRCIEATYAYDKSSLLANSLGLTTAWYAVAASLDDVLGWHPQEASSINIALQHANRLDLAKICRWLSSVPVTDMNSPEGQLELVELLEKKDLEVLAGRAIYKLRNQIVHYRPTSDALDVDSVEWNGVCNVLVTVALDVFSHAYAT